MQLGPIDKSWNLFASFFEPGSRWLGMVSDTTNSGAYIDLPGNFHGRVQIFQIAGVDNDTVASVLSAGQLVTVEILSVYVPDNQINLRLLPALPNDTTLNASPVVIKPEWLTEHVIGLAESIRASAYRDPTRVAILADALEEAGCTSEMLLLFCRNIGNPRKRHGWWVAEAVLLASGRGAFQQV